MSYQPIGSHRAKRSVIHEDSKTRLNGFKRGRRESCKKSTGRTFALRETRENRVGCGNSSRREMAAQNAAHRRKPFESGSRDYPREEFCSSPWSAASLLVEFANPPNRDHISTIANKFNTPTTDACHGGAAGSSLVSSTKTPDERNKQNHQHQVNKFWREHIVSTNSTTSSSPCTKVLVSSMGSAEDLSPSEASSAAAAHNNTAAPTQVTSNGQLQHQFRSLEESRHHAATQQDVLHLQQSAAQSAIPQQGQQHQHETENLGNPMFSYANGRSSASDLSET